MIYYEITKSLRGRCRGRCNGCILSIIDEKEYEITLKEYKNSKFRNAEGLSEYYLTIVDKETKLLVLNDFATIPMNRCWFKIIKPTCSLKKTRPFCLFTESFSCCIKEISEKEALLKIL